MIKAIRVGTRPSALALKQVKEVQERWPWLEIEVVLIQTRGDKDKISVLSGKEGSDFFTHEIEQALLDGIIDAAIHSAKDIEKNMPEGLAIAAITPALSPFECLVSREGLTLDKLPVGCRIGTSSCKRKEAIKRFRPDLAVKDIRGNIDERLAQLDEGKFDAVIIAQAALIRLEYEYRISQIIPKEIIAPHPLQGRIAIQIRKDRQDLLNIFKELDDK